MNEDPFFKRNKPTNQLKRRSKKDKHLGNNSDLLQFPEKSGKYTEPITIEHLDDIEKRNTTLVLSKASIVKSVHLFFHNRLAQGGKKSVMTDLINQVFDSLTQETV